MKTPDNKTILMVIAVLLLGILGFLAFNNARPQTLGEAIEEAAEEISDEIDDHTTAR